MDIKEIQMAFFFFLALHLVRGTHVKKPNTNSLGIPIGQYIPR